MRSRTGSAGSRTTDAPFDGFHLSHFSLELLLLVARRRRTRRFRFPLLVLARASASAWFFVTDLLSNGGNWSAVVTLVFGLAPALGRVSAIASTAFWVHVVAGLTIGGALLWFWHSSDLDWILIALASLVYVADRRRASARSSYAVLGAFGLFLVTTHFVVKWFVPLDHLVRSAALGAAVGSRLGGRALVRRLRASC